MPDSAEDRRFTPISVFFRPRHPIRTFVLRSIDRTLNIFFRINRHRFERSRGRERALRCDGFPIFHVPFQSSAPALPFSRGIGRRLVVCRLFPLHLLCGVCRHLFLAELVVGRFSRQIAHFVNAPLPCRLVGRCPWKSPPNIKLSITPN